MMRTTGNTLYTGYTNNLKRRVHEHISKGYRASKYIKSFLGSKLVYYETYPNRRDAMRREYELKKLTHDEKERMLKGFDIDLSEYEL